MKIKKNPTSFFMIIILLAYSLLSSFSNGKWKSGEILNWDIVGYYHYLPATMIYQDLGNMNFLDSIDKNYNLCGGAFSKYGIHKSKETKFSCNQYPCGVAIFELPLFTIAHVWATISKQDKNDGYSSPYQHAVAMSSILFVFLGLFILRKFLSNFFTDFSIAISLLIIYLGTNLFQYTVGNPGMSHPYLFFITSSILLLTYKWYNNPKTSYSILIGICIGLAAISRPIDILIFLIPLLWNNNFSNRNTTKIKYLLNNKKQIVIVIISTIITTFPLIFYWKYTTNHWLYYSYTENDYFEFNRLRIVEGLLSYRKGWFVYSPLLILGFVGMFFIPKKHQLQFYKLPFTVFFILIIYLVFSWHNWIYGWGLGCRALIQTIPLLAIPMCFFTEYIFNKNRLIRISYSILLIAFVSFSIFQTWQYNKGIIHGTMMNKKYYWSVFFKTSVTEKDLKIIQDLEEYNWSHHIDY
jgi:hypothetical protein